MITHRVYIQTTPNFSTTFAMNLVDNLELNTEWQCWLFRNSLEHLLQPHRPPANVILIGYTPWYQRYREAVARARYPYRHPDYRPLEMPFDLAPLTPIRPTGPERHGHLSWKTDKQKKKLKKKKGAIVICQNGAISCYVICITWVFERTTGRLGLILRACSLVIYR